MTRQDEIIGRIGPLAIKRVSKSDTHALTAIHAKARALSLSDRLLDFLNVNPASSKQVISFIKNNAYTPKDVSIGWVKAFALEQEELRTIAEKILKNDFSNVDLKKIVIELETLNIKIRLLPEAKLAQLNEDLYKLNKDNPNSGWSQSLRKDGKALYPKRVIEYTHPRQALWHGLLQLVETKRPLKQCKDIFRCRKFFFPNIRTPNQEFCSPECNDRFKKRKTYQIKKVS